MTQMTDTDVRDVINHINHFGSSAVVRKIGGRWFVDFRGFGCPSPFKTKRAATDWACNWPSALRMSQRVARGEA